MSRAFTYPFRYTPSEDIRRAAAALIERIAREQDYAKPNERIFIDISGK